MVTNGHFRNILKIPKSVGNLSITVDYSMQIYFSSILAD